jgi:hypothetical protein
LHYGKLCGQTAVYKPECTPSARAASGQNKRLFSEVTKQMASVRVGQFHARDAEGRVYPVHVFQESPSRDAGDQEPVTKYRLAIGDRLTHLGGDDFELAHTGVRITRIP